MESRMGKIKAMRIPEGAVVIGEHMYFKTAQNVDLKDLSEMELKKMAIRDNMKAENDAIMMYSKYIDLLPAGDPVRKGLEDIRDEEKEHAGELHQLLVTLDPSELYDFNEGVGEVKREQGVKSATRNTAGKKGSLLDPEPLERFEDKWDGNMYACTTEDGVFFVKRVPDGLEGAGSFEWIVLWNEGGSNGEHGFEDPRVAFDDMLKTLYVEERRGSITRVANGWSTDGITCTLEEDNVKLFVEPELDKWRWDVNVDGELFDTGLADSMPEAQICAEDCAEDAIGHSFIAEKTERNCAKGKRARRSSGRKRFANEYDDDLREVEEALRDEIEYGARFEDEDDVRYFVQDFFQQTGVGYGDEWMDQTDFALENMDIGKYVTGAKRGKHAKRRKKAGLLLDWQDMGGGQYVVKGDLCDGVVFEDGGSWSWRLYDSKWDRFDDTYGYYGDGFGSKEEAMDDIERSLNALKRMFGSSSPKVDEVYNEKWYG